MLKIQRASAGSGKTYTLTLQYILNLIAFKDSNDIWHIRNEKQIEDSLQHILAITFTNKATNEMKERIITSLSHLSKLAVLSDSQPLYDKKIPYIKELQCITHAKLRDIGKASESALKVILNNYSIFKIATIDSFFQEILRIFAYETNIAESYQLEIDSSIVIEEALESAFQRLDTSPSKMNKSSFWLKTIMQKEAQKTQQWNPFNKRSNSKSIYNKIKQALQQIENEDFKEIKEQLDYFFNNFEEASTLLADYYTELKHKATVERENLLYKIKKSLAKVEDLIIKYKYAQEQLNSNFLKQLAKISELNINDIVSFKFNRLLNDGSVFKKKFRTENNPLDSEAMNLYSLLQNWNEPNETSYYKYWKIYGELLPYMGLIIEIKNFLSDYLQSNNIIQLHDTSFILKKIIGDNDVPFIYEKLGNRIEHYLIDEFQDTSQMQWDVIHPLLKESVSNYKDNLIIGDPKQSIYRFRNAKHELITKVVPKVFPQYLSVGFSKEENTNWRSHTNIVKFNNYIFKNLAYILQNVSRENGGETDFIELYSNVIQYPHNQEGKGYVEMRFFEKRENSESDNEIENSSKDWYSYIALKNLGSLIHSLKERGYSQKDIAILVNTNEEGKDVVKSLIEYNSSLSENTEKIDFISEESLLISSSFAIETIVNVLEKLTNPLHLQTHQSKDSGEIGKTKIYHNWNKLKVDYNIFTASHPDLAPLEKISAFLNRSDLDKSIPSLLEELSTPSITSIVEMIVSSFLDESTKQTEGIYISAFQDLIAEYSMSLHDDPASFLDWWYSKGSKLSVSSQETIDAIQIMTIHKSKGLEFKCVIIPFATDSFIPSPLRHEWRWVKPIKLEGLQEPPVLPIKTNSELKNSYHEKLYSEYFDQVITDKLNMYYVAFTRAKNELYVFTKGEGKTNSYIHDFLAKLLKEQIQNDILTKEETDYVISLNNLNIETESSIIKLGRPFTHEEIIDEDNKKAKSTSSVTHFFKKYYINNKRPRLRSSVSKVLPSGELSN